MIIGVTHDNDGRVVQRLSVSTKVAISIGWQPDRDLCGYGQSLD